MPTKRQPPAVLALLACVLLAAPAAAENWPNWRGPRGDGTSLEANVPLRWSATENIAWKVELPGTGHASPIVWQDRVFLAACLPDEQRVLLCLDRKTGRTLWRQTVVSARLENKHARNSHASGTPATDGQLVYATFLEADGSQVSFMNQPGRFITPGEMVVAAYDFEGKQRWLTKPGRFSSIHGFCSSPVLFEDKVIINGDHDGESYLVALDRATGETVWKVPRENKTRSYSTPIFRQIGGRWQMILSGNMCIASYDPNDGSRNWIIDGPTEQFVASMVSGGDLLFATAGYPDHHILAIRPDGQGNVTDTHIAWRTKKGCSYVPSPVVVGKYLVVVTDGGVASCFEAETGRSLWMERLGGDYSASLVTAGGLVYCTSEEGITKVIRPGESLEIVAQNDLNEICSASPAISQGQIFIRTEKHLYAIGR